MSDELVMQGCCQTRLKIGRFCDILSEVHDEIKKVQDWLDIKSKGSMVGDQKELREINKILRGVVEKYCSVL